MDKHQKIKNPKTKTGLHQQNQANSIKDQDTRLHPFSEAMVENAEIFSSDEVHKTRMTSRG